ncbi:ArnT family glycosyltransferase [Crossiella cryophila]|uniref:4-amino-4-deoxy-L-arabinose transferase-like glycosyltransferase n=1 Tax=Crossiella cryophila TaxID=43355 RepID=A0A7W7FWJ7_9PSEU|nr:glycosyltransferase family 39 protein [Crossiella cryophila]MBB4681576.1 4-amino-4-deoxy-L-arabinose transferase-like glycosyltransferase [Crossiella cryophila]
MTRTRWRPWALLAICVLAAVLYGWALGSAGWGNAYYSAAVKSMSQSFTNFLFASFDPAGVVTVDKPPMGLWPQVLSVWILGYSGWAVLLPQVIAGVAAVFLLHRTVRRWAGENVALLAALVFALTPITVAINQDNNPDTLLVLLLVAAAYALTRAVERGIPAGSTTRWLLLAAFLIGCGFLTKMLQAWIVVPVFLAAYLVAGIGTVRRRIADLFAAAGMLVVSSFWWVAVVDLWPGEKPYIGGSTDGTALDLVLGYNGLGRIFGRGAGGGQFGGTPPAGAEVPSGMMGGGGFGGTAGPLRMFNDQIAGQISWLLPLCAVVLILVAVTVFRRGVSGQVRAGWVLWGGWLLVTGAVFSFAEGTFHPYYTTMLAPAVAAVSAAGARELWRRYREPTGLLWLLLPWAVGGTAVWAFALTSRDTGWQGWTRWAVAVSGGIAVLALLIGRLPRGVLVRRVGAVAAVAGLLLTPAVWSAEKAFASTAGAMNGTNPTAGPATAGFGGRGGARPGGAGQGALPPGADGQPPGGAQGGGQSPGGAASGGQSPGGAANGGQSPGGGQVPGGAANDGQSPGGGQVPGGAAGGMRQGPGGGFAGRGTALTAEQRKILDYANANSRGAQIVLAVEGGSMGASAFLINSDVTVIGMGGFSGGDPAPSVDQLSQWKAEGKLAFVLSEGPGGRGGRGGATGRATWIEQNCTLVDPSGYGGTATGPRLYSCLT